MLQEGLRINSNFWNEIKPFEENIFELQLSKLVRNSRRTVSEYELCHRYKETNAQKQVIYDELN